MIYGSNTRGYGGQTAYRQYNAPSADVPAAFPGSGHTLQPGVVPVVSFRPPMGKVISGALDTKIVTYLSQAPRNSLVCAWHEGNGSRFGFDPHKFAAMNTHILDLVKTHSIPVKFGAVFGMYPVYHQGQKLAPWLSDGLDFVGLDGYQTTSAHKPDTIFGDAMAQLTQVPKVLITETNSNVSGDPTPWLLAVWAAYRKRIAGFLWFSGADGFPEPPAATVERLAIAAASASV